MLQVLHDFFLFHTLFNGNILDNGPWFLRARFNFIHILHQPISHGLLDLLLSLIEFLLAQELIVFIFKRLVSLFTLVDLLLVVRLARVEQRVLEELENFVHLLVHLDQSVVDEGFELLALLLGSLHRSSHLLVQLLDNEGQLLYLKLLALDLAILVLYLAGRDIEIGLELFKFCHADHVLADLDDLELKLLVLNRSCTQLIAQLFDLVLIFIDLRLLLLGFGLQFSLTLLEVIDFDQVLRHFIFKQFYHLFMQALLVLQFPF